MDELRILTPGGMLGYGIDKDQLAKGLALSPHAITIDSGSTDSGPHKLGLGAMTCSMAAYERDIATLLEAGAQAGIPVYISSAGGDGEGSHVDLFRDIVISIARKQGRTLRTALIYADIDKDIVRQRLVAGRVSPLGPVAELTSGDIDEATAIVAQMGAEPFIEAQTLHGPLDLIITGRAYDPAPLAALGIANGFDSALAWHMGKIMECGGLCAEPATSAIFGILRADSFEVEPLNAASRCTPISVAAHTLYEKTHPLLLAGPGGVLDLTDSRYEAVSDRRVRVSGSRFRPDDSYRVKLEGACVEGYRAIAIMGARDRAFIAERDPLMAQAEASAQAHFDGVDYRLCWHRYGENGVLGELEPDMSADPKEICLILEVQAETQDLANAVCGHIRSWLLHAPFPGRISTSGNIASPFTPLEIPLGPSCRFSVYHLMDLETPTELFPIKFEVLS